jgi:twitching motility two-component system response regulator PilG
MENKQQADSGLPRKVLVVDDSKTVRRSAAAYLEEHGLTVITANDGFEALAKVVEHQPSIIFADIVMPRLDGYQTCALIKNNADYRHIPVVMLSSKDGLFDRARGRVVGADAHLAKPFDASGIVATMQQLLNKPTKVDEQSEAVGNTSR